MMAEKGAQSATGKEPETESRNKVFSFKVPGTPAGKPRSGTSWDTEKWIKKIRTAAAGVITMSTRWAGRPIDEPVSLTLQFGMPTPKEWGAERAGNATGNHRTVWDGPDIEDLVRAVTDGMEGTLYADPVLVGHVDAAKHYAAKPHLSVVCYTGYAGDRP